VERGKSDGNGEIPCDVLLKGFELCLELPSVVQGCAA